MPQKEFMRDLKEVYKAHTEELALAELSIRFEEELKDDLS